MRCVEYIGRIAWCGDSIAIVMAVINEEQAAVRDFIVKSASEKGTRQMTRRFELSGKGIIEALEFLGDVLHRKKVSEKDIIKTRLLSEEWMAQWSLL